jgi:hypothetical protein
MSSSGGGAIILSKEKAQKSKDLIMAGLAGAEPDSDIQAVLAALQAIIDSP